MKLEETKYAFSVFVVILLVVGGVYLLPENTSASLTGRLLSDIPTDDYDGIPTGHEGIIDPASESTPSDANVDAEEIASSDEETSSDFAAELDESESESSGDIDGTSVTTDGQHEAAVGPEGFHQVGTEDYAKGMKASLDNLFGEGKNKKNGIIEYTVKNEKGEDVTITANTKTGTVDGFYQDGKNLGNAKLYGDGSLVVADEDGGALYFASGNIDPKQGVKGQLDENTGDYVFEQHKSYDADTGEPIDSNDVVSTVTVSPDDNKITTQDHQQETHTELYNDGSSLKVDMDGADSTGKATYTDVDGNEFSGNVQLDENGQPVTDEDGMLVLENEDKGDITLNKHGAVMLNMQEEVTLSDLAERAGSWSKLFMPGAFANSLTAMGRAWWDGEAGWLDDTFLARMGNVLDYEDWAESICARRRLDENNKGFFTTPNGDVVHFEAEKTTVDPCGAMEGLVQQAEHLDEGGCQPYAVYKVSGMIMAKSVNMSVVVELKRVNGEYYNLYGEGTKLKIGRGQLFSLIGANMHIFQSRWDFDQICWKFKNWDTISRVLGGAAWQFDGKVCQDIAVSKARGYQEYEEELAGGGAGGYTPQDFGGAGDEFGDDDFGDATGNDQSGGYTPENLGGDAEDGDWDF